MRTLQASEPPRVSSAPVKPLSSSLKPSRNTVYLYPEDLTKLRQLSGYASTEHGIRANDSILVRAAPSLMDTDVRFLRPSKMPFSPTGEKPIDNLCEAGLTILDDKTTSR